MPITLKLALRDVSFVIAILCLWRYSHHLDAIGSTWRVPVAIVAGLLIPVAGFLAHEWGHLLGALSRNSVVHMPKSIFTLFLFEYRTADNSREQFLGLSCGGFMASGLVVALLLATLSFDHLADQVALGVTLLGVIATLLVELPPAWRVYRGGPLPE